MGQYHRVVNLDTKQYLNPHSMGLGAKLPEFSSSRLTDCLIALLACSNGRGGGDFNTDNEVIGHWAGNRIAVVGDYWGEDYGDDIKTIPTWDHMNKFYTDVSMDILTMVCEANSWMRQNLLSEIAEYDYGVDWSGIFTREEVEAEKNKNKDK